MIPATIDTVDYIATIENCDFTNNEANIGGGGYFTRAQVINSRFSENRARDGGGTHALVSEFVDCNLIGNAASAFGGGAAVRASTMTRCLITDNEAPEGGGVHDQGLVTILSHCVMARNSADRGGGYAGVVRGAELVNCTIADNEAPAGSGVYLRAVDPEMWFFERTIITGGRVGEAIRCAGGSSALLSCTDVFGNAGGDWIGCIMEQESLAGNLRGDPMFCQAGVNWNLCSDSPCAPEQAGACGLIGALSVGCDDCGPQALEPSTWGQVKYQIRRRFLAPAQ
jgi:hypothetical protein